MILGIAFIVYPVKDISLARQFYEEILALKIGTIFNEEYIEYDVDGVAFAIDANAYLPGPASSLALEVDDLDAEVERLKMAEFISKVGSTISRFVAWY